MYTLKIPRPDVAVTFSNVDDFLGPFSLNGEDPYYDTKHRHPSDFLIEQEGIFGENHCQHRQISGSFRVPIFQEPEEKAGIRLDAVDKFGNIIGPTTYYHFELLSSSFSWKLDPRHVPGRERLIFLRKLGPFHTERVMITWHYVNSTEMVPEYVSYIITTCEPTTGEFKSHYIKKTSFSSPRYGANDFRRPASADGISWSLAHIEEIIACAMRFPLEDSGGGNSFIGYAPLSLTRNRDFSFSKFSSGITRVLDYELPRVAIKSHGELAIEAVDTLDTHSVNLFEFVSGLRKPWELLPKLKNLGTLKNAAENYLTLNYGILPTIDDLNLLKDAILSVKAPYFDRNDFQVLTSGVRETVSDHVCERELTKRVKIAIDTVDYDIFSLQESLRKYGAFPSVDNLWELIPFSFVIDWFANIGDILESLDNRMRMAYLPITYSTISTKDVARIDIEKFAPDLGVSGTLYLTNYSRAVSPEAPSPPLSFEVSNELPSHWLEAGALIVANQK